VKSHDGVGLRAVLRSVAFLTAGVLAVPALTACSEEEKASQPEAGQDIAPASRALIADGGTLRWAVDAVPETLNTFQADADSATSRVAGAVLPAMFRIDRNGRPQANPDYLESAKIVETEPKQVVLYKLNQQAVWSDGREIDAADFAAQWRALSGKDSAYWTARNAGYDRIEKIERGKSNLEVRVTFGRPYADWKSLFSPLYPKDVMGSPGTFNDGARKGLPVTAGPFALQKLDRKAGEVHLTRNPRWWGRPTKLAEIDLVAVRRGERAAALAANKLDLAEIDPSQAERITLAARDKGSAPLMGPGVSDKTRKVIAEHPEQQAALRDFVVRKSLEPVYTQLALNGSEGPLADERVRRAVARALDRKELARVVLGPLGLPAEPVGSHLALSGQQAYADNSGALGGQDTAAAQALLSDAGWVRGGPIKEQKKEKSAGSKGKKAHPGSGDGTGDDGRYVVGEDNKPAEADREKNEDPKDHTKNHQHADEQAGKHLDGRQYVQRGGAPGAYAPKGTAAPAPFAGTAAPAPFAGTAAPAPLAGTAAPAPTAAPAGTAAPAPTAAAAGTAAPAGAATGVLAKDGKPLSLRFVVPSGPGSESLRAVAERISRMLERIGVRTEMTKVSDGSYFKDHIASGQYDLALYSWPASAFPATDARPIFAKPVPAADGSLSVEQNYTRVGTDQVDQLFDQAIAELDEDEERDLVRKADAHIWAAAGSIPLYQRPQLTAARATLANTGSFGFQTPVYEDMGFLKKGARPSPSPSQS